MRKQIQKTKLDALADRFTDWVGSTSSIVAHTIFFIGVFALKFFGITVDHILLILTTVVSLEAIYLAIFIQMSVNRNTKSLEEVEEDIDEIQEDVEGIEKDIDEIQEDVEEIEKDVDEIQEDIDEEEKETSKRKDMNDNIELTLQKLLREIEELRKRN